ncbi:MAG: hypothetical protein ABI333_25900 [bacterium]
MQDVTTAAEAAKPEAAKPGYYWNYTTGDAYRIREGDPLPAPPEGTKLVRIPAPLLLLLSPVLGLGFVIFLPLFTVTAVPLMIVIAVWRAALRSTEAPKPQPVSSETPTKGSSAEEDDQ